MILIVGNTQYAQIVYSLECIYHYIDLGGYKQTCIAEGGIYLNMYIHLKVINNVNLNNTTGVKILKIKLTSEL